MGITAPSSFAKRFMNEAIRAFFLRGACES